MPTNTNVVIDTNVIISGFINTVGKPGKIVNMVISQDSRMQICYNTQILEEYENVLTRPHFNFVEEKWRKFLDNVKKHGTFCDPPPSTIPLPDETDRCFYDVAKFCKATLITGNTKHYPSEDFILSPADFLGD
ncbi:MAG: putative toxin-antitoxin system toxin component, PIN family [Turicibacter sp.]|nr:putative toxin-antitoxin system toxin component, PIN family [Turicibacter sp.]